jgi:peptide/nickel transport system permease protein
MVGLIVGLLASAVGLAIGLASGYSRVADAVVMRIMDGLMSIPAILLAIALMSVARASILTVIFAITLVEIPRVVRLVRSVVLTLREQTYVEAAIVAGTRPARIVVKHILPNTLAALSVQTTYICAAAMLVESILSFLGAGTPPEVPSWGNIMAEGRTYFQIAPWLILSPGLLLGATVLAVNLVGDGLRGMLDPRLARRM